MINLWPLAALLVFGVGALPFSNPDYVCKDPDTGKYYSVNETWTSTTFCGNYTCKLRKRVNSTDEPVLHFNHDNTTHSNNSTNKELYSSDVKLKSLENINEKPRVTITARTLPDIQSITHKNHHENSDIIIDFLQSTPPLKLLSDDGDDIDNEDVKESWEMKMLKHDQEIGMDSHKQEKNKRNSLPIQMFGDLGYEESNNEKDGYLKEDEIKIISKLLHKIKRSDIEAVVQIYNIAQEIYKKMDKVTDENLVEETINDLKDMNIKKLPDKEYLRHVSDLINEGTYAIPQFASVTPHYNYNIPQSQMEHAPAGNNYSPLGRPHYTTQNYQIWNPYQSNPLYNNMDRRTATTTGIPVPVPGNYGSPIYTSQTISDYNKPIAVGFNDYVYYEPSNKKPIGSGFQHKPIVVANTPVYYPYQYTQLNMTYPVPYPTSYLNVYDKKSESYPVNYVSYYPVTNTVQSKENTKDCVRKGKTDKCIKKKSKKGTKDEKSNEIKNEKSHENKNETKGRTDKMPDWQTKPLNKTVLDEIKANILEKTTLLPLSLRKKVKLEKVGKVIKLDDWIRKKRAIFSEENETLTKRDVVGIKGHIIENKHENKKVINSKPEETDYSMQNSEVYSVTEKNNSVRKVVKDKFEKKLENVMDFENENENTNQEYEAYIEKTLCNSTNKTLNEAESDSMDYIAMEKNPEEDYNSFFNSN